MKHRNRATNKGEEYIQRYPILQKWINQCGSCQQRGLKPSTPKCKEPQPGHVKKVDGYQFRHLHDYFKVLELDGNDLCDICRRWSK